MGECGKRSPDERPSEDRVRRPSRRLREASIACRVGCVGSRSQKRGGVYGVCRVSGVEVAWEPWEVLISQYLLVSADSCDDDIALTSDVSRAVVHRDAEGPVFGPCKFFVPQAGMRWIPGELFQLLPEFDPDFLGEIVQFFQDRLRDNDVSRQSLRAPL